MFKECGDLNDNPNKQQMKSLLLNSLRLDSNTLTIWSGIQPGGNNDIDIVIVDMTEPIDKRAKHVDLGRIPSESTTNPQSASSNANVVTS